MATRQWIKWIEADFNWLETDLTREEAYFLIDVIDDIAIDGGPGPGTIARRVRRSDLQKKVDAINKDEEKRKKLVSILVKVRGEEYELSQEIGSEVKVRVSDVEFLLKEAVKVKVEFI